MAFKPGSEQHRKLYANFARGAYGEAIDLPEGWINDPKHSNRNRQLYVNLDTKEAVYAFRGTVPKGQTLVPDMATNAALALGFHELTPRFRNALKHSRAVARDYPGFSYTATGHSQGGSLAQYVTKKLKWNNVTYNPHVPTNEIHRRVFDDLLDGTSKKRSVSYTTSTDPIALGQSLLGSHRVPVIGKDPHSLANFL
jgi:hypothetical protein